MANPRYPLLTRRQLNRATLARQLLLEPSDLGPVTAIERIGGLQAQEPASPYLALWARLRDFDPAALDAAFREARVVKATLMRITVHAVTRADYVRFLPAVLPVLRAARRGRVAERHRGDVHGLAEAALEFAAVPRSNVELRDHVAAITGEPDAWWRVRRHAPFVHVPTTAPWSFGRRPILIGAPSWVGGQFAPEAEAVQHLVRRHLAAFGPATIADIGNWSGLAVGALRGAVAALDSAGELRRFSDEAGRDLLDLHATILPPEGVPAPPRLLPMWDSVLLAHADRTRVLPAEYKSRVIMRNGDVLPTFLVDGRVAGLWWAENDGARTRLILDPFIDFAKSIRQQLEDEAERLAAFVEPHEPNVYARYRWDRTRK